MIRIIIGALLILGTFTRSIQTPFDGGIENYYELQGYLLGKAVFFIVGIWLLYSGIIKLKKKKKSESPLYFYQFVKVFFTDYKSSLSNWFKKKKVPYFFLMIVISGTYRTLMQMHHAILGGNPSYPIQDWFSLWLFAILGGIILGFILYWLIGSIFHLGVLIAGGEKNAKTSRLIYLYSGFPVYLAVLLFMLVNMIVFESEYFQFGGSFSSIWAGVIVLLVSTLYSYYLAYIGVRTVQRTKRIPSILLYIIFPLAIQIAVYFYI